MKSIQVTKLINKIIEENKKISDQSVLEITKKLNGKTEKKYLNKFLVDFNSFIKNEMEKKQCKIVTINNQLLIVPDDKTIIELVESKKTHGKLPNTLENINVKSVEMKVENNIDIIQNFIDIENNFYDIFYNWLNEK